MAIQETRILKEQQSLMVAQQSASVLPYVTSNKRFELRRDTAVRVTYNVVNTGVGPALLSNLTITLDGEAVRADSLATVIQRTHPAMAATQVLSNTMVEGILPVDADVGLFTLEFDLRRTDFGAVTRFMDHVRVDICYCSVYGNCWTYHPDGWNQRTEDCRPPIQIE
ncbi:hypothetical protein E4021_07910 [Neolewinella litorea]|uniref:Uncharacterized protein n=1 Tax=Neolewinella litorea TaxID=2562452 RepID=A0A4S4NNP1_9BACT|nr:hypothetical protein E4021_07910 [Neolewinella litorea]